MIVLNDTYYVEADSLCFSLKRKGEGVNKDKEKIEVIKTVGYYGDLQGCIQGAIKDSKLMTVKNGDYNLDEALVKFREINEEFTEILNKVCTEV